MTGFREEPAPYSAGRMTKAAFLAWNQDREGPKCELKNGEIVMHPGTSINHSRVLRRITILFAVLDDSTWDVLVSDVAVEIEGDVRYPDLIVAQRASDGRAYVENAPKVIVELPSPSSVRIDMVAKAREYLGLPSLEAYVVASQDEAIAWTWLRDPMTREFSEEPIEIAGRQGVIELSALGPSLPLAEIYRGVGAT